MRRRHGTRDLICAMRGATGQVGESVGDAPRKRVPNPSVLLSESAFFSAMLTGSYRESESGVIAIHDDAPCLSLGRVVKWLHTGEIRITDVYDALEIAA
jgi:hypothetical protein